MKTSHLFSIRSRYTRTDPAFNFLCSAVILLSLLPFHPVMAEEEPNDVLGQASPLPSQGVVEGVISQDGDMDWYRVTFDHRGRFRVSVIHPPRTMRAEMTLFGRHAEWLGIYSSAINDGDDLHLSHDVFEAGVYFLRFRNLNRSGIPEDYRLSTTFVPVSDSAEPNPDMGSASLISSREVTGKIFPAGDEDYFKIHAGAGEALSFSLRSPSGMRSELTLYGPELEWLGVYVAAVNAGDVVHLGHPVLSTGFYYLRVRDILSGAHLEDFTLDIQGGQPGFIPAETPASTESEPNDPFSRADLIGMGGSISGGFQTKADIDWFVFDIIEPGQAVFKIDPTTENAQLSMQLMDASGRGLIQARAGLPGARFSMTYNFARTGRFYLRTHNLLNLELENVEYRFETELTPVVDLYEPNEDFGDAVPLNAVNQIRAYLFDSRDVDWYRVQVTDPGTFRIILSNLPSNITPAIHLYDSSRQQLNAGSGHAGMDFELRQNLGSSGHYYVRISDQGSNDLSIDPYTLTLFGAAFNAFAPVARIDTIDPGAIVSGDSMEFTGSGEDLDGQIEAYNWRSSLDGDLSDQPVFATNRLSIGTHDIFFRVRDNDGIWSTEVVESVYVGSTISDEQEPNGKFSAANEIGLDRPLTGKMDVEGDEDYYKVYLPDPGRFSVFLSNIPVNLRLELVVYNRYWDWIGQYANAVAAGDDVALGMDVADPGWIFMRVRDLGSKANAEFTYTLSASLEEVMDPFEPNNNMVQAVVLPRDSVTGHLFPANDEDWFKVWVLSGETVTAELPVVPAELKTEITLYGKDRQWLGVYSSATNPGDLVRTVYQVQDTGYYYIRVRALDGNRSVDEAYELTVSGGLPGFVPEFLPQQSETETNNRISDADPVALNSLIFGSIQTAQDEDWYVFEWPSPGMIQVEVSHWAPHLRGRIDFFADDSQHLGERQATNPGDALVTELRLTNPGIYYARLRAIGANQFSDQPYHLTIRSVPIVDLYEPNNRFQDAVFLSGQNQITGHIYSQGDVDYYKVRSTAGAVLRVLLGDVPPEIRPQLDLYDWDQRSLTSMRAGNEGQSIILEHAISEDGDYTIRVSDIGNNSVSALPYTLVIDGAEFESYAPFAFIESISPNPADADAAVAFVGFGEDADGQIVGYRWRSSIDGVFSISQAPTTSELSPGIHTIYFEVRDNQGNRSSEVKALLFLGVPAPEEIEPNDVAGSATLMELDRQYKGTMNRSSDEDWYRIRASGPGRLVLRAVNPPGSAMRLSLQMYSPDLDWAGVTADATNDGDEVSLTWNLGAAADYYLRLRDSRNRPDGEYTISASFDPSLDPFEPNGDFEQSFEVADDDQLEAFIFPRGDEDWYRFSFDKPGTMRAALSPVPSNLKMEAVFYGPNLEWLGVYASAINVGDNVFLNLDVPASGDYYLRIRDVQNGDHPTDSYRLTTQFDSAEDLFEPNQDYSRSAWLRQSPVEAQLFPSGDYDFYKFNVSSPNPVEIRLDPVPENLRLEAILYNANLDWIGLFASAQNEGESVSLQAENLAGIYYLRIRDLDNDRSSTQSYRLSVTGAQLDYVPDPAPNLTETEPNNNLAQANPIGWDEVSGLFTGDEDWYRFELSGAARVKVNLEVPRELRCRISLFDGNRGHLHSRDAENPGDRSELSYHFPGGGTYYLRLSVLNGDNPDEAYRFSIFVEPDTDAFEPNPNYFLAQPIGLSEEIEATPFPEGDQDWYYVDIPEPGLLRIRMDRVPMEMTAQVQLYSQNLVNLVNQSVLNPGDPLRLESVLSKPGRYWMKVLNRNSGTSSLDSYSLQATLQTFVDANEPNNSFHQATLSGDSNQFTGLIFPVGDWDWYRVRFDQTGDIRIQLTETGGFRPDLRLWSDSKTQLERVYAGNTDQPIQLRYQISMPDTYYISVSDVSGNRISSSNYSLTLEGGSFSVFHPLVDAPLSLSPTHIQMGQSLELHGSASDLDGSVVEYEWSSNRDGLLGNGQAFSIRGLSEGLHRIGLRVRDDGGNWSGRWDQSLLVAPGWIEEAEFNNEIAQAFAVPLEEWVLGVISPENDQDYYRLYVDQCGLMTVMVDPAPWTMRAELGVFSDDGGWLGLLAGAQLDGESVQLQFHAGPGYYQVRVRDMDRQRQSQPYALRAVFVPGADAYESNNSFSEATKVVMNQVVQGLTICPPQDEDWFRLDAVSQGRLVLSIGNVPEDLKAELVLFDKNFNWIGVYNGAMNQGERVFLNHHVTVPGAYYLRIRDLENKGILTPFDLNVGFEPVVDGNEPNQDHSAAVLMSESTIRGIIFGSGDEDWYRVFADAGSELYFSLTDVPDSMRGEITIYGPDREWIGRYEAANNPGDRVYLSYTAPKNGMVYIRVRDVDNRSLLSAYSFNVAGDARFGFEPDFSPVEGEVEDNGNWSTANDISLSSDVSGEINPSNDNDLFRFWVNAPGILEVEHSRISPLMTSELRLYNASLSEMAHRTTTNPGESNLLEAAIMRPGYYYIKVNDRGGNDQSEEPYLLKVSHTSVVDEFEPNNSIGSAALLGKSIVDGFLFDGNDEDFYRIYLRQPGLISLSLDQVPLVNRPRLRLYDSNGSDRGSWVNTNPGVGGDNVLEYNAPRAGLYYIRVSDEGRTYAGEAYTLRIEGADFSTAPVLTPVGDRFIDAGIPFALRLNAEDPDNPENLTFSAVNLPPGAWFDASTRMFHWKPGPGQAGPFPGIHFEVSDGEFTDSEDITITVAPGNHAPVLDTVGKRLIFLDMEFSLTLTATDPDADDVLSFTAENLPDGAVFDPETATLTWTPSVDQIGIHSNVLFTVTDGIRSDFEYVDLEVSERALDPFANWMQQYFTQDELLNPAMTSEDSDPDDDGMTNRQEFLADTHPKDFESALRIRAIVPLSDGIELHITNGVGADLHIESSRAFGAEADSWVRVLMMESPLPVENRVPVDLIDGGPTYYRLKAIRKEPVLP